MLHRHRRQPDERNAVGKTDRYGDKKTRETERSRQTAKAGREIGSIPNVVNPRRRRKAEKSFRECCQIHFKPRFPLPWSNDHLELLDSIQRSADNGDLLAVAMPRGSGKTTILAVAIIWAVITGRHKFGVLLAATNGRAADIMASIQKELLTNDLLLQDWPEAIFPFRAMEGIANRCKGQLCDGTQTAIEWGKRKVVFPTIPKSPCSGAVLCCGGLLEAVRGLSHSRGSGDVLRPTLALVDDPQTRRSAQSPRQTAVREAILAGDVLYLSGPGHKIAGLLSCTVIQRGDLADRILDRTLHPEWHGIRKKLLNQSPDKEANSLWDEYAQILRDDQANDRDMKRATSFYRKHRKAMDAGADPSWAARMNEDEISAVQHCMNLMIRDREAFMSEMQNEPTDPSAGTAHTMTSATLRAKTHTLDRRCVPLDAQHITAFVDVGKDLLWWSVVSWTDTFTGYVLDYGPWPDQHTQYVHKISPRYPLKTLGSSLEERIVAGLSQLTTHFWEISWEREDGTTIPIELALIDANWGDSTDLIYTFCRRSRKPILPSHGKFIGASSYPLDQWKKSPGERRGTHWTIPPARGRLSRYALFDSNYWKSFLSGRLSTPIGVAGSLSFFRAAPQDHQMIADHCCAEYPVETTGRGRTVTEWKTKPGRPDNDLFDCLVGCAVAASMCGCRLDPSVSQAAPATTTFESDGESRHAFGSRGKRKHHAGNSSNKQRVRYL